MAESIERQERTVCDPNCHANPKCGLMATISEGKITKISGAEYPVSDFDGRICLMGRSRLEYQYHPDRLTKPLKRVGPRGDGKWEEISWPEAIKLFTDNHKKIAEKYGPKSVAFTTISGSYALLTRASPMRYAALTGASFIRPSGFDFGIPKGLEKMFGISATSYFVPGGHCYSDSVNSDLILIWGGNPAVTRSVDHSHLKTARRKGARLICIDPVKSETAELCDDWISIRPGSDGALALGMINHILKTKSFDADFLKHHTDMPYLVRGDTGAKLRAKDIHQDGNDDVLMWSNSSKALVSDSIDNDVDLTYAGEVRLINGERCKVQTVYNLLAHEAKKYTPNAVANITGIPAETVSALSQDYVKAKPAAIRIGYGVDRWYYSDVTARTIATLATLTGNLGVPGGGVSLVAGAKSAAVRARTFYSPDGKFPNFLSLMEIDRAVREAKPYPVKMECITLGNPYNQSKPNRQRILDEYIPQLEFIAVIDHFMTDTAKQADLVLPACTIFERTDIVVDRFIQLQQRMVEPEGEAKSDFEIFGLFAKEMGFGSYFEKSEDDYLAAMFPDPEKAGLMPTFETVKAKKVVYPWPDQKPYIGFADRVFPTSTGRVHIYVEELMSYGSELAIYREPVEASPKNPLFKKYPFVLLSSHSRYRIHSTFANMAMTRAKEPEPIISIHPKDAAKHDMKDGDIINVFNNRGKLKIKCKLDEAMRPGCVLVREGHWVDQFIEGDPYILTHDKYSETAENYAHYDVLVGLSAS